MAAAPASAQRAATPVGAGVGSGRLSALDGLRGLAAVIVVVHHTLLALKPHLVPDGRVEVGSLWWWLDETPLKIFSAGGEAVVLFFVLSGLVVALPPLRGGAFSWAGFLASRFVRILVPAWGALLLASALILLIPRNPERLASGWITNNNATTVSVGRLLDEATLSVYSFDIDNVLWSLRWEMIFAVLLPLFLLAARALRRVWLPAAVVTIALSFWGFALVDGTLSYLPAFFVGTLMAVNLKQIREAGLSWESRPWFRVVGPVVVALALLGIIATWLIRPAVPEVADLTRGFATFGSALLIAAAIMVRPVGRLLSGRVCAWLGRVSFSLYLVHVPVIVAVAYLLGDPLWPLWAPLGIALAFVATIVFFRFVERPSHALARRAGAWLSGFASPSPTISPR